MFSNAQTHFINRLSALLVHAHPFPHIYGQNVFPDDFYEKILKHMPETGAYAEIKKIKRIVGKGYGAKHRDVIPLTPKSIEDFEPDKARFWRGFLDIIGRREFMEIFLSKFLSVLENRFGKDLASLDLGVEILLIRDRTNYSLGPHTDHPSRIATFILYLPADAANPELGTSLYVPKKEGQTCVGGPHHKHENFNRVATVDYLPNSVLGFAKSLISFHGVEPVKKMGIERNLLHVSFRNLGLSED